MKEFHFHSFLVSRFLFLRSWFYHYPFYTWATFLGAAMCIFYTDAFSYSAPFFDTAFICYYFILLFISSLFSHCVPKYSMVDPGWGIWGKCPPPPTLWRSHLLIKILNFMPSQVQLIKLMKILCTFFTSIYYEFTTNQSMKISPSTFVRTKHL